MALVGFAVTGGVGLAAISGKSLIVFELNPLHNIVHLAVGTLLAGAAATGATPSKKINVLVGAVYLLVGIVGFALVGSNANIIALNHPDNLLHLATAVVLLAVGLTREPAIAKVQ